MTTEYHAYNKESTDPKETRDGLLNKMPDSVKPYGDEAIGESLTYDENTEFCVYIGHVRHYKRNGEETTEWDRVLGTLNDLDASAVFIHCSSAGRKGHSHRMHGGLAILELQPRFGEMSKEQWKKLLQGLDANNVSEIVKGKVPSELSEFFEMGHLMYLLPAICILCQGYLATQPDPLKGLAGQSLGESTCKALTLMGWEKVKNSDSASGILTPALKGEDKAGLEALRIEVASDYYWMVLGEREDLVDRCAEEWLPTGTAEDVETLKKSDKFKLITALEACAFPIEDSEIVAYTYLALHERLGGLSEPTVAG
ncbi:MAG: hypothetical protein AB2809_15900 [Candidatus Thiodiazotropha sp.]